MKQVLQNPRLGQVRVADVPAPIPTRDRLLIRNAFSALSVGTERQMLEFGRKSLLGKARSRPDLLAKVIAAARTEGIREAVRQASSRLNAYVPLGYSSSGMVVDPGGSSSGYRAGDRVACFGSGFASHAELISVPPAMCVPIPADVETDEAAFATIGAIALHALKVAHVRSGDVVVVVGLGFLGLIALQIGDAWDCRMIGVDLDDARTGLAASCGAVAAMNPTRCDVARSVSQLTHGAGADVVVLFASTDSNQPLELAATLARDRGRIVAPGLVGLNVPRRLFFDKELELAVPRAWGAGFDGRPVTSLPPGHASPAQQNVREFLGMLAAKRVRVAPLVTDRLPVEEAADAYRRLGGERSRPLGVLLSYTNTPGRQMDTPVSRVARRDVSTTTIGVGLIGAGVFARATILPVLRNLRGVRLRGVATASGSSASSTADTFGFEYCTTDPARILSDPDVQWIIIATRHHLHAAQVVEALRRGKNVFVEKPLALTVDELRAVLSAAERATGRLMVGFNRRFAPRAVAARAWLASAQGPTHISYRINANPVPSDHWIRDRMQGGGRVLGEICHFVDLFHYFTGSQAVEVSARPIGCSAGDSDIEDLSSLLTFADGSLATLTYTTLGTRTFPRERLEAFRGGTVCVIDNFRRATCWQSGRKLVAHGWSADRGHRAELAAFADAIRADAPLPFDVATYAYSTLATICLDEAIRTREAVDVRLRWQQLQAVAVV